MLSIIPTPIGNLKDITIRAIEALKKCDIVFCEDTRRTLQLLSDQNISKKVLRYNDHIEKTILQCLKFLQEGKHICLLTDSGMPTISDPGWKIVKKARENNIPIEILPGPSALITALAGSGLPADAFIFLGFLPRSQAKIIKILKNCFLLEKPIVLYESPYRLKKFITILKDNFSNINIVIAKELTKAFEQWFIGNVNEIYERIKNEEVRGEITLILHKYNINENEKKVNSKAKRILFVCTGNTCRSVFAHYYFEKLVKEMGLNLETSSAGIYVNKEVQIPEIVLTLLRKENIEIKHIPEQINYEKAEKADTILTMTKRQKEILKGLLPDLKEKIYLLSEYAGLGNIDITDPYSFGEIQYEMTFKTIKNMLNHLAAKIKINETLN